MNVVLRNLIIICIGTFVIILFIVLFTIVYRKCKLICIKKLEYKRYFSKEGAFQGESIYLIEELINHSFLPMNGIGVESHVTSMIKLQGFISADEINQHFISVFDIKPFTKIIRKHKAVCMKRGYYRLETAKIEYEDTDIYMDSIAEIYVYPKEIQAGVDYDDAKLIKQGGISKYPVLEDVFMYSGIRRYTYGDSLGRINHKASARSGTLMVNSHDYMLGKKVKIYNNFQMPQDRFQDIERFKDMMEKSMSYISYIIYRCALEGCMFSYSANCKTVDDRTYIITKEETGTVAYQKHLREFAMSRIACNSSFCALMDYDLDRGITDTHIYVFTSYMDESVDARIQALKKQGNEVEIIYITDCSGKEDKDNEKE